MYPAKILRYSVGSGKGVEELHRMDHCTVDMSGPHKEPLATRILLGSELRVNEPRRQEKRLAVVRDR